MYSEYTFKQGIHPDYHKELTRDISLRIAKRPGKVIIPLQQHIGAPCSPLVKVGEHVKLGQKIGDTDAFVSAPVHASVSGIVKSIEDVLTPSGKTIPSIIIEADETEEMSEDIGQNRNIEEMTPSDIKYIIWEAGIVGMGGAMFPTHVKLSISDDKKVDYLIINGAECEPYLTVDHRLMVEKTAELVSGIRLMIKVTGVSRGIIAVEDNKPEAYDALMKVVTVGDNIDIKVLKTKYPQGGEKMLIKALLGKEVPVGGLPLDVGVVVNNVSTAIAVHNAVFKGLPLIQRAMTITGSGIKEPCNIIYRIGTPLEDLIDEAGGLLDDTAQIITGGPMMGMAQPRLDIPAVKGTSGLLVLTRNELEEYSPNPCIRCARCVDVCPVFLLPLQLARFSEGSDIAQMKEYHIMNCLECGCCSYICPAKRPLVQYIRMGKKQVRSEQMKQKGAV